MESFIIGDKTNVVIEGSVFKSWNLVKEAFVNGNNLPS